MRLYGLSKYNSKLVHIKYKNVQQVSDSPKREKTKCKQKKSSVTVIGILLIMVIKFLGENPGACPWDEAKKYFSKSLMSISSEYTLQI